MSLYCRLYFLRVCKLKCHHVNNVTFYTMLLPRSKCKAVKGSWTCRLWKNLKRCRCEAQRGRVGCVGTKQAHPNVADKNPKMHFGSFGLSVTSKCHLYITEVPLRHPLNYSGWCVDLLQKYFVYYLSLNVKNI